MQQDFCGPRTGVDMNPRRIADADPGRVAMLYYGRPVTYSELVQSYEALARWLVAQAGVRPGDRVAIDMQNAPQYVIAFYATLAAGGIVVPLNPMYRPGEVGRIMRDCDARVAIFASELRDRFEGWEGSETLRRVEARYADYLPENPIATPPDVVLASRGVAPAPGVTPWSEALRGADAVLPATTPDDRAVLPYTSGSTGVPKGCLHDHRSVMHTAVLQAEWYSFGAGSVVSAVQPLFHVAGMQSTMNGTLYAGGTMLLMTRWDAEVAARLFAHHGLTDWIAPPTMVIDMLGRDLDHRAAFARLRCVTGGGSSMPQEVAQRMQRDFGLDYIEGYGMSETMSPTHINPMDAPLRGSVGVPVAMTACRILDPDTLAPVAQGEVGEVCVRGPQVMRGYWQRPEEDAKTFVMLDGERFLRTGDLGFEDAEGRLRIVDRLKRMINASGFKVWPSEVERMLHAHPAVTQACVIAAPDPYRGETVKALVVADADTTPEDILAFLKPRLATYKLPRQVEIRPALPMTASHKIDWRRLQDEERASRN